MSIAKVVRRLPDGRESTYERANLDLGGRTFALSGPNYGAIADGKIETVNTGYPAGPYHLRLEVLTEVGQWERGMFRKETLLVTFLELDAEKLADVVKRIER